MAEAAFPVPRDLPSPDIRLPLLSFRRPSRSVVTRFFAHLLVRLLIVTPLPAELQAAAALFPVSMLWPLVQPDENGLGKTGEAAQGESAGSGASESQGERCLKGADPTRCKRIVNFVDPTRPFVAGHLKGVGSRLALSADGILYSTDRAFVKGTGTDMTGIHTAALETLALVEGTDPYRVVVGEGPRAAEKFKLKLRVIPKDFQIKTAKVEFVYGGEVLATIPEVNLKDGRGEVPLPLAYPFPGPEPPATGLALPRLVLNEGTPDELVGPLRRWNIEQPEVQFVWGDKDVPEDSPIEPKDEEVTADLPEIDTEVVSAEWFDRFDRLPESERGAAPRHAVAWEARSAPAYLTDPTTSAEDGIFETTLKTGTVSGEQREVVARVLGDDGPTDVILGVTDPLIVQPGLASEEESELELARESIPADGASKVLLTLTAKDQHGNLVADGTVVVWEKSEDADGEFAEPQEVTTNGIATATYVAGVNRGSHTLRAHVDDAQIEATIEQAGVSVAILAASYRSWQDRSPFEVTIRAQSAAGAVADGAPLALSSSIGRLEETQPLKNGEAKARWRFGAVSCRPKVKLVAVLGEARFEHQITWDRRGPYVPPPSGSGPRSAGAARAPQRADGAGAAAPVTSVAPMMMAGDRSADGYVPIEKADGSLENVFVKATGAFEVTGLTPGKRVSVRLGTSRAPNLMPVVHFTGEDLTGGWVPDATGVHHAQVTGGVTLSEPGYQGQGFTFDGTGVITVTPDTEFQFPDGFSVQTAVRPPPTSGEQTLIAKGGDFRLALVRVSGELRAQFSVTTAGGEETVTSLASVPEGEWSVVTGRYDSGRLWIGIDGETAHSEESAFLSEAPRHSLAEIQIGPGFTGELDEMRLFDLTRRPLSTFAGGATSLSFTADATGDFAATIVSTGELGRDPRSARYFRTLALAGAVGLAQEEPPPTTLQDSAAPLVEIETFYDDEAERATTWYGFATAKLLGSMVKMTRGLLVGSEAGEFDLAVMAGDMVGSFALAPAAIVRDLANSGERVMASQASGQDALDMAVSLTTIAASVMGGKVGAFLKIGKLAKALPAGSRAGRTMARLLAIETKLAAGAAGASRIKKLLDIAQGGAAAAQMVGVVLDVCGVHVDAIEAFNIAMTNAPDTEQQGVLETFKTAADEMEGAHVRTVLTALATPYDEVESGAQNTGLPKKLLKFVNASTKASKGATDLQKALRAVHASKVSKRLVGIATLARRDKQNPVAIYEGLADLAKMLAEKSTSMARMGKRLASESEVVRRGQRLVLETALTKYKGAKGVLVEKGQDIEVVSRGATKTVKRFYDLILNWNGKKLFIECKNWDVAKWVRLPPSPSNIILYGAWSWAKTQFMRDIAHRGPEALDSLRWILPKPFLAKYKGKLVEEFEKVLLSEKFKKMMGAAGSGATKAGEAKYKATLAALGFQGGKLTRLGDLFEAIP